jgi:hypothetical protein
MTNSLIEALEKMQRYAFINDTVNKCDDARGAWIQVSDLRAIIEQYKTEGAAHVISNTDRLPVDVRIAGGTIGKGCNFETLMIRINAFNKFYDDNLANKDLQKEMRERLMKLTEPSPAIVGELVKALEEIAKRGKTRVFADRWSDLKIAEYAESALARAKAMTE